jgi:murein DD-endopeptidase MepM/ murein hydrolase activator NlpD
MRVDVMRHRPLSALLLAAVVVASATAATAVSGASHPVPLEVEEPAAVTWRWPVPHPRIVRPYVAPPSRFAAGHRGIDLSVTVRERLRAPADGVVAFSASVAGRGVVTIDHGRGYVSTFEPVDDAPLPGTVVRAGEVIARAATGGHTDDGAIHVGVRLHGEYINPLLMWGGVPRAVLLPCC